jgi:hypothetical protein
MSTPQTLDELYELLAQKSLDYRDIEKQVFDALKYGSGSAAEGMAADLYYALLPQLRDEIAALAAEIARRNSQDNAQIIEQFGKPLHDHFRKEWPRINLETRVEWVTQRTWRYEVLMPSPLLPFGLLAPYAQAIRRTVELKHFGDGKGYFVRAAHAPEINVLFVCREG